MKKSIKFLLCFLAAAFCGLVSFGMEWTFFFYLFAGVAAFCLVVGIVKVVRSA